MSDRPRKAAVTAAVLLIPVLVAILALIVVHLGGGEGGSAPRSSAPPPRPAQSGLAALSSGAPVPRMRLLDARSGADFDTAALRRRPYVVAFLSVRCAAIGNLLRRAMAGLGQDAKQIAVIAVSSNPKIDTRQSASAWLKAHDEPPNFHFLIGDRRELRPYWHAWGVAPETAPGAGSSCPPAVPLYLVAVNHSAGVIYAGAQAPTSSLVRSFRGLLGQ
jgi:protein SCO1